MELLTHIEAFVIITLPINEKGSIGGCVYTEIVKNVQAKTLQQIIKGKVSFDSTVYTDGFRSYDSIVHLGYQKHFRIYHQESYGKGDLHINGIEGF